jgi:hypothetical protein
MVAHYNKFVPSNNPPAKKAYNKSVLENKTSKSMVRGGGEHTGFTGPHLGNAFLSRPTFPA